MRMSAASARAQARRAGRLSFTTAMTGTIGRASMCFSRLYPHLGKCPLLLLRQLRHREVVVDAGGKVPSFAVNSTTRRSACEPWTSLTVLFISARMSCFSR